MRPVGSPGYAAPEVIAVMPQRYNEKVPRVPQFGEIWESEIISRIIIWTNYNGIIYGSYLIIYDHILNIYIYIIIYNYIHKNIWSHFGHFQCGILWQSLRGKMMINHDKPIEDSDFHTPCHHNPEQVLETRPRSTGHGKLPLLRSTKY